MRLWGPLGRHIPAQPRGRRHGGLWGAALPGMGQLIKEPHPAHGVRAGAGGRACWGTAGPCNVLQPTPSYSSEILSPLFLGWGFSSSLGAALGPQALPYQ